MTGVLRLKYLFLLGCSLLSTAPALAQDSAADDESGEQIILYHLYRDTYITVVATGQVEPLVRSGQSISVVGRDEIEAVQGPDLTRVLEQVAFTPLAARLAQALLEYETLSGEEIRTLLDSGKIDRPNAPSAPTTKPVRAWHKRRSSWSTTTSCSPP